MKKVKWQWDYGIYVPFCPYCDEPAYEKDKCFACGKPYEWVEGKYKDTIIKHGEYTIVQATNNHISIYKNGEFIHHAQCDKKMTEKEMLGHIKLYEDFCKDKFDKLYEDESEGE